MTWLFANWPHVIELAVDHLVLSVPTVLVSVLIAIPIGRFSHLHPRLGAPLLQVATVAYAIPALPLLIIIPALLGVPLRSQATVIVALSVYGVALLARTAADAFGSVDLATRDAAVAIGYSQTRLFWGLDLPLAIPVLISGTRVVTVSTISLVTIGALVGVPSLGSLLTDGFQRGIAAEVWTGVIATVVLALLLDGLVVVTGRMLAPWHRAARRGGASVTQRGVVRS